MSKLRLYVKLARPFTLLPPLLGIVSGAVCAFGSAHNPDPLRRLTWAVVGTVALGSLCAAFMNAASNAINQVYDLEIDRLNKPGRPLVTGELSLREAWGFTWVFYALALVPVWLVVPYPYDTLAEKLAAPVGLRACFFIYLAGLLFTFVYSAPRLGRTKTRGMLANWTIAIPRGMLLKVAGWGMVAPVWYAEPWYIGGVFALFLLGAASTKDFADIEGDRAGGCRTLPIIHGVEKAAWIMSPFFVLPWLLVPLGIWLRDPADPSLPILTGNPTLLVALGAVLTLWGCYTVWLLVRDPSSLTATENHPSWRHMYLMLMAAQVGFAVAYMF
ncbi:MAG TPA: UbiA family prenyltransferase [Thermoanaerobaculia bacterium]|nr:UbiA family prenyltransferase [Thermoanaerobaculia bacterium]